MNERTLKVFIMTSKRICNVWKGSKHAIFLGMLRAQFPGLNRSQGNPSQKDAHKAIIQALESWNEPVYESNAHDNMLTSERNDEVNIEVLWWDFLKMTRFVQRKINGEVKFFRAISGGERFEPALTYKAIVVKCKMVKYCIRSRTTISIRMDGTYETRKPLKILLEQPKEVQTQFLDIAAVLANKFAPRHELAPWATQLGASEHKDHIQRCKMLEEGLLAVMWAFGFFLFLAYGFEILLQGDWSELEDLPAAFHLLLYHDEINPLLQATLYLSQYAMEVKKGTMFGTRHDREFW